MNYRVTVLAVSLLVFILCGMEGCSSTKNQTVRKEAKAAPVPTAVTAPSRPTSTPVPVKKAAPKVKKVKKAWSK